MSGLNLFKSMRFLQMILTFSSFMSSLGFFLSDLSYIVLD